LQVGVTRIVGSGEEKELEKRTSKKANKPKKSDDPSRFQFKNYTQLTKL